MENQIVSAYQEADAKNVKERLLKISDKCMARSTKTQRFAWFKDIPGNKSDVTSDSILIEELGGDGGPF